jgi:hypothetical protein
MAPPDPPILAEPRALEPAWLTDVFQSAGFDVCVRAVRSEPIGTGQMAHAERIFIEYKGAASGAPTTLVGKFPSPHEASRAAGAAGGYRAEVLFYTELADSLSIRTPACYYGAISEDSSTFTLLLEDMAPARQGDQIAGASDEQIEAAVVNLAGLHAPRWNAPSLREIDWIPVGANPTYGQFIRLATPAFLERYAEKLPGEDVEVLQAFAEKVDRWVETQPRNETLVHGDYRLDNLLFGAEEGGVPVAAVDWQTLSVGAGGRDLAYLLGNSSAPDRRRAHEDRMLDTYRRSMAELGAPLSVDTVREEYRHGSFQGPFITILGAMAVGQTERGDEMFVAMAHRSATQIRDLDALSLLG